MQILTTGKNLDIGDALRQRVEDKLSEVLGKYFDGILRCQVVVEKQRAGFVTECTLYLSTGLALNARGEGGDAHSSFDTAAEHLETRLRRYKRRLKNHHASRREPVRASEAASYVLAAEVGTAEEEPEDLNPVIIAESTAEIAELSVGEAVMQLDISNAPFVLFRNGRNGSLNVVYRRNDGQIGWVDPGTNR